MATSPRATARFFETAQTALYGPLSSLLERAQEDPVLYRDVQRQLTEWLREDSQVLAGAMQGKTNNVGTVTLTASQATTTLTDARIGAGTIVVLCPTTANAAAEVGAGGLYQTYPNTTKEQAVINHANNAQTDRDFAYALIG